MHTDETIRRSKCKICCINKVIDDIYIVNLQVTSLHPQQYRAEKNEVIHAVDKRKWLCKLQSPDKYLANISFLSV